MYGIVYAQCAGFGYASVRGAQFLCSIRALRKLHLYELSAKELVLALEVFKARGLFSACSAEKFAVWC